MRKKTCILLACLLLALLLGSCAYTPGTFDMPWVYDKETEETDSPDESEGPQVSEAPTPVVTETPAAAETPTPTETPALTETPEPTPAADPLEVMMYGREEIDFFNTLWPLKEYTLDDFGTLTYLYIMSYDDCVYYSLTLETNRTYKDIYKELKHYISGAWDETDGIASVKDGQAEGYATDCYITEMDTFRGIDFTFTINGSYAVVSDILDAHWPEGVIEMPDELNTPPYSRYVALTEGLIYMSREWDFPGYRNTFESLRQSFTGEQGFEYFPQDDETDEYFSFSRGSVTVEIGVTDKYNAVNVTYIIYPPGFSLS